MTAWRSDCGLQSLRTELGHWGAASVLVGLLLVRRIRWRSSDSAVVVEWRLLCQGSLHDFDGGAENRDFWLLVFHVLHLLSVYFQSAS